MPNTYPNQRIVQIHRETFNRDFLGIKNENWMAAARDLRAHAFLLYLYFASNANNFTLALSQVAVQEAIGMPRSTYHDQFKVLVNKGYLVKRNGNTYDFFEKPQPRADIHNFEYRTPSEQLFSECTTVGNLSPWEKQKNPQTNTEINNINIADKEIINISVPKVKEITIPIPTAETKERARQREIYEKSRKKEFIF